MAKIPVKTITFLNFGTGHYSRTGWISGRRLKPRLILKMTFPLSKSPMRWVAQINTVSVCRAVLLSERLWTFVFQEIASILKELMRVQRQLEGKSQNFLKQILTIYYQFLLFPYWGHIVSSSVINTVMDPCGQPGTSWTTASAASSSCVRSSRPALCRDLRAAHSASKGGGGPRPGRSSRRAAVSQDDVREGYLVWEVTNRPKHLL